MTKPTDWNLFYQQRGFFSRITACLAFRSFLASVRPHLTGAEDRRSFPAFVELGGGNSVFYTEMRKTFPESPLILVDLCPTTQDFSARTANDPHLRDIKADLCAEDKNPLLEELHHRADVVFSFGLIEHFNPEDTRRVIAEHFAMAKTDGLVYLSFPTPVLTYRLVRRCLEGLGQWPFHDERPLTFDEVRAACRPLGEELGHGLCLRMGLVQGFVLYRAHGGLLR